MSRYFTKAITVMTPDPDDSGKHLPIYDDSRTITVHEEDRETFTGLYSASGEEIHRTERVTLGFCQK